MNDYESFKKAYGQGTDAQKESRERRFGNNENYRNFKAQWEQNPQPQLSNPAPVQNQFQNQTFDSGSTYNNQVQIISLVKVTIKDNQAMIQMRHLTKVGLRILMHR